MTSASDIDPGEPAGLGSSIPPGSLLKGGGATKMLRFQWCLASTLCDQYALPSSSPFVGGARWNFRHRCGHEYVCISFLCFFCFHQFHAPDQQCCYSTQACGCMNDWKWHVFSSESFVFSNLGPLFCQMHWFQAKFLGCMTSLSTNTICDI